MLLVIGVVPGFPIAIFFTAARTESLVTFVSAAAPDVTLRWRDVHARARKDWGYGAEERLTGDDLVHERYRGIRPAFGYPACPDHSEKPKLFALLGAERTGMSLTESFAMTPAASVSGLYFAHPQAKYFNVGRIGRDQLEDYAARKGMDVADAERWLASNLAYEPLLAPA